MSFKGFANQRRNRTKGCVGQMFTGRAKRADRLHRPNFAIVRGYTYSSHSGESDTLLNIWGISRHLGVGALLYVRRRRTYHFYVFSIYRGYADPRLYLLGCDAIAIITTILRRQGGRNRPWGKRNFYMADLLRERGIRIRTERPRRAMARLHHSSIYEK